MEEQNEIEEINQKQQLPWLLNILFCYKEGKEGEFLLRESSISYNTKEKTVIIKKPTLMHQRAQEEKQALQQYSWTSSEEESIHTAEITAIRELQIREDMRCVIYTDLLTNNKALPTRLPPLKGQQKETQYPR